MAKAVKLRINHDCLCAVYSKYMAVKACGEFGGNFEEFLQGIRTKCDNPDERKKNGKLKCFVVARVIESWLSSLRRYAESVGKTTEEVAKYEYERKEK